MIDGTVKIIKHKVGLLNLAEELGDLSKARKVMGLSRGTFYRYRLAVESGGLKQSERIRKEGQATSSSWGGFIFNHHKKRF